MFATGAGILTQKDGVTSDGLQEVFMTNLFGHFLLVSVGYFIELYHKHVITVGEGPVQHGQGGGGGPALTYSFAPAHMEQKTHFPAFFCLQGEQLFTANYPWQDKYSCYLIFHLAMMFINNWRIIMFSSRLFWTRFDHCLRMWTDMLFTENFPF